MPFTPFHFGPGLFAKSLLPRHFSWLAFIASQVLIDCETLFYLVQRTYPVHRFFHTLLGGAVAGAVTGVALVGLTRRRATRARLRLHLFDRAGPSVKSETATVAILVGALVGGLSHSLLDGLMHPDVRPFAPWGDTNPLLGSIGLGTLHLGCLLLGLVGAVVMFVHVRREGA